MPNNPNNFTYADINSDNFVNPYGLNFMVDGNDQSAVDNLKLSMKDFESQNEETFKDYATRMIGDNQNGLTALN